MVTARYRRIKRRLGVELERALAEKHSPREVAGSFSLGTFITMLPTLGTGLILFVIIVAITDRVSKIALFASVVVFNPVVKWGVYALSFSIGVALLGPVDGVSTSEVSMTAGPEIVLRLLVGNLLLAIIAMVVGYFVAYRVAIRLSDSGIGDRVEGALENVVDELVEEQPSR